MARLISNQFIRLQPGISWFILAISLLTNALFGHYAQTFTARPTPLAPPPSALQLRVASLDEPVIAGYWTNLYVQNSDVLLHTELRDLDYAVAIEWLDQAYKINPQSGYSLLLASRFFGELGSATQRRQMLEFVYAAYLQRPQMSWPWLAHATFVAQHGLHDLPLALKYARALREQATDATPIWARQMEVFVLENMSELDSARILLGNLLKSGQFQNPQDFILMQKRLQEIEARAREPARFK